MDPRDVRRKRTGGYLIRMRFVLQFSFIIYTIFGLITSVRNRCNSGWHYLSDDSNCIMFATTGAGDVSWTNSSNACEANSAELLTLSDSTNIRSIERKINENKDYLDHIQRGTWIGKAKWLENDLCDNTSTTNEDHQLNCIILTIRLDNQTLCLKKVSCIENHPFICQTRAMTENEFEENAMKRVAFWKCLLSVLWCVNDDLKESDEKKKQDAATATEKALAAAELQSYVNQFDKDAADKTGITALMTAKEHVSALSDSGKPDWLLIIGGGFITLLVISICSVAFIYAYKNMRRSNRTDRTGSIDSTYST